MIFENINERKKIFNKISRENKNIDVVINNAAFVGDTKLKGWNTSFDKQV